jgi:hypothetical protein
MGVVGCWKAGRSNIGLPAATGGGGAAGRPFVSFNEIGAGGVYPNEVALIFDDVLFFSSTSSFLNDEDDARDSPANKSFPDDIAT